MSKDLLRAGLFYDALGINPKATKKEILYRIMDLEREYSIDQEMLNLLKNARDYLIHLESEYREWMMPCLDYIYISILKKYSSNVKGGIINHGLLKFESIKKHFEQNTQIEIKDPLDSIFDNLLKSTLQNLQDGPSFLEQLLPLNSNESKIDYIKMLLHMVPADLDYIYFDGSCDNTILLRKRAYEIALEIFRNLPNDPSLLGSLGFCLIELGDIERALTCLLQQSEKAGEDGYTWNNIAWCLMRLGRYEEAITPCERALELLPHSSDVHYVYATILAELSRWDKAISAINTAISILKPSDLELLELYYLLPFVLERKGEITSAVFHWKQYLKLAKEKKGHEKAVLRIQEKLREKGYDFLDINKSSSEIKYPIRKISEEVLNEGTTTIQQVVNMIKNNVIRPQEILTDEELKREIEVLRQKETEIERKFKQLEELEPECERIFREAFDCIKELPFIDSLKVSIDSKVMTLTDLQNKLAVDKTLKNIPYSTLLRDVVSPLIKDVLTSFPK